MMLSFTDVFPDVMDEWRAKSKSRLYADDIEAWAWDVLGERYWSKQLEFVHSFHDNRRTAVKSSNGSGKLVSPDTRLPTPTGWLRAGDAVVGDLVLDEGGNPTRVSGVTQRWDADYYRVMFDDGSHVDAHANHEWSVLDTKVRCEGGPVSDWRDHWGCAETLSTLDMLRQGLRFGVNNTLRWKVPNARPLQLPEVELPIDPYLLGLWLADGGSRGEIPVKYLRASESQRRDLLAGLMDGCGFVDTQDSSYVVIHMGREDLIDQIYELVVSLGHKVRKDFVHGRYRLNWRPLENPFRVGGERWADNPVRRSRHTARVIVSIEPVVAEASYCIEVDSPRHLYLAGDAMIPTHNSRAVGSLICHWVTTCEAPGDNLALVTGPALKTVRDVVWQYMNDFYGVAIERNAPFPGTMYSSLQDLSWRVNGTGDKKPSSMAIGLKPGDGTDIVGAFQGRRGKVKTAVFMDEAGSLHADIFTAAEAVTTGPESRILAIGNPDNGRGSEFFKVFNEPGMEKDWKHFTISAFMLPTFTGEIVYPGEPHKQAALLNTGMPDPEWVDNKRRMWGEGTSRWKAKVLGEFPDDDDNVLFSQAAIDAANSCDIVGFEGEELILGVDLAFGGLDETQVYANRGGHIRRLDGWSKATPLENARRIHGIALENGAVEVRVDAGGAGEGVYNMLDQLEEFRGVGGALPYDIIGMKAGNPSPDPSVWAQARSWWYDEFRKGMLDGRVDLSVLDSDLQDEIISQTYDINRRGALQVTPKKEMRRVGLTSPDHLDAAIMSFVDPFAVDDFESKTEMYDNDMMFETLDEDDFLADFRAYRW